MQFERAKKNRWQQQHINTHGHKWQRTASAAETLIPTLLFVSFHFDRFFSFFNKTIELENVFGCFCTDIMVNPNYLPHLQNNAI